MNFKIGMYMKKTAYIHLGLPKTGTTAMQSALQYLFDQGELDKYDMQFHHKSTWSYIFDYWINRDDDYFIEQLHKDIQRYSKLGEKNVIFSNEALTVSSVDQFNSVSDALLGVLAKAFSAYNIKIIIYLRRQDIFYESLALEKIKIARYIDEPLKDFVKTDFDYKKLLDSCTETFGKENLIIRVYDRNSFYKKDAISDFLNILGFDEDIHKHEFNVPSNPSLSPAHLRITMADNLQYILNKEQIDERLREIKEQFENNSINREKYGDINYKLLGGSDEKILPRVVLLKRKELLGKLTKQSFSSSDEGYLAIEQRKELLAKYAESNAAIAREYLNKDDGILFSDVLPTSTIDSGSPTTVDLVQTFMPIIIDQSIRLDEFEKNVHDRFAKLEKSIEDRFEEIEKNILDRFNHLEKRLDVQEHRINVKDEQINSIDKRLSYIKNPALFLKNIFTKLRKK